MEIQAATGEWMNEFMNISGNQGGELYATPSDIIKQSISRNWTISDEPRPKWKGLSGSIAEVTPCSSASAEENSFGSQNQRVNEETMNEEIPISDAANSRASKFIKLKSKSLNTSQDSSEEARDKENEIVRTNSDKKVRYKSQKMKMKIKRQASLEDQFPGASDNKEETTKAQGEKRGEELKIPKIEVNRKNSVDENFKNLTEYTIVSPNSSKLRERFSKSKLLRNDSKNLNVEHSKSSDSGLGISRSTEDESVKTSENVILKFFETGQDSKSNKSDSERSPNFLDTVSLFSRPRSRERSVSSDSSDKNLSDLDKPSIKIRKRHEYSESRDSSSSFEGNFYDTHISNRVRKLHEVALKQMSEENSKSKPPGTPDGKKRSVEFKYPVEFGSCEAVSKRPQENAKLRKFRSLDRAGSSSPTKRSVEFFNSLEKEFESEGRGKSKERLKKQDRVEGRSFFKDSFSRDFRLSGDRKKEKRFAKGLLKSQKNSGEDESDENAEGIEKQKESTRLSRKDKKGSKKLKRALSEEKQTSNRDKRSLLRSMAAGQYRSDSETRQSISDYKSEESSESGSSDLDSLESRKEMFREYLEMERARNANSKKVAAPSPKPPTKLESVPAERSKPVEYLEIGPYLEEIGKMLPISDDYKLVFISSDSSAKENRSISSDSESGPSESSESGADSSKKVISDFDWDYFESSSVVKPVIKDWSWSNSGKFFNSSLLGRSSPVCSTSDDNSPKFTRRNISKFSVMGRDSPVSSELDAGRSSPFAVKKPETVKSDSDGQPTTSTVANASEERKDDGEIEISDLKVPPPSKSKDIHAADAENVELLLDEETRGTEEGKKAKKRRKSRKHKTSKEGIKLNESDVTSDGVKSTELSSDPSRESVNAEEESQTVKETTERASPVTICMEEADGNASCAAPDGVSGSEEAANLVEDTASNLEVDSKCDPSVSTAKSKTKKHKNKKKLDKRVKSDDRPDGVCSAGQEESTEAPTKTEDTGKDFNLQQGSFGFQSQNIVPTAGQGQFPEVFSYNRPISNVCQNFVPIPVLVPIPVPFPVPAACWSQSYQNFVFPNFFNGENFELFNNLQNIYTSNYLSQNQISRNEENKEASLETAESEYSGNGNSSVHIRPISMQRPALTIGPVSGWSQGFVNSTVSDPTCLSTSEVQSDNDASMITKDSVANVNCSNEVANGSDSKKGKKGKRARRKSRNSMEKVDETDNSAREDYEALLKDVFVEGKTFDEVKNTLKHKTDFADASRSDDCSLSADRGDADKAADESVKCELFESSLLNIDKKSTCSSSSNSDESDSEKPFKKSYYFNLGENERKTSDDSDIADLSGPEEDVKSDFENTSHGETTTSEDEGNPDPRFSEVLVLNHSESEESERVSKSRKKYREAIPGLEKPCLSSEESSDDSGGKDDLGIILLKHIKKLPEDDREILMDAKPKEIASDELSATESMEMSTVSIDGDHAKSVENENGDDEHRDLHNSRNPGEQLKIRSEDPVILVPYLSESKTGGGSVDASETVPECLPIIVLDNNTSKPGFNEIKSADSASVGENAVSGSFSFEDQLELGRKTSANGASDINDETEENLQRGDVSLNAESSVNNGDLVKETELCVNKKSSESERSVALEDIVSCDNSSRDISKSNQYGHPLLDTIESRIRHFTQLESRTFESETKYTSLVMITQENGYNELNKDADNPTDNFVKVIANDTTKVLDKSFQDDVCLKHTNGKNAEENSKLKSLEEYFTMTLENSRGVAMSPKKPNVIKNMTPLKEEDETEKEEVQVVTDDKTLSAVICLEEGLADDDSWVEDLDKDRENDFATVTEEDTSSGEETHIAACTPVHMDREEELRGYHRGAINFTLHTIVEESCEESEMEDKEKSSNTKKQRPPSATDLEKYFYFDIGGGVNPNFENQDVDTFSESSSSIYSDGGTIDDNGGEIREKSAEQNQLSTSRLEKYFLNFDRDGREKESDGSVGSDSEGPPSPEQRRKRLFRARASSRLHSSSLDNLVQSENEQQSMDMVLDSEDSSTETDEQDLQNFDKSDDSVKRKKKRKISGGSVPMVVIQEGTDKKVVAEDGGKERESLSREHRFRELKEDDKDDDADDSKMFDNESDDDRCKTPQPEFTLSDLVMTRDKQQSRDSGFIGSCDDLLKDQKVPDSAETKKKDLTEDKSDGDAKGDHSNFRSHQSTLTSSVPPAAALTRKDSFNNWSSDEETNLMMSKMRQFFKAMVSVPKSKMDNSSPQPNRVKGAKPPQLVYFENELTRLMKTVPGIRDDQVREIVEYLSSEDTWSDSYDSSDYTSSDLEGTAAYYQRSQLQQEISESCKQIIDKFDQSKPDQEQRPKVPPRRNSSPMNRETAFVYQKLVASFNKITNENENPTPHSSPPFFAKVMHHIGSRLVALMHEVSSNSSGEGSISSHKSRYHKRISQKLSNVSSTTEEECGLTDESDYKAEETGNLPNPPYFTLLHQLPRSKSHDLLLEEAKGKSLRSSSSGVSDIVEEKEASDYERFSWRGSFESALMADSRSKLTLLSNDAHSSNATLAAKRRSAGDLLFLKSLSREQLDRVRSCGSIGGAALEDKTIWTTGRDRNGRRSSVPDAASPGSGASADGEEDSSDSEIVQERSITLPRSLQSISSSPNTNSLPRLPTTGTAAAQGAPLSKAHSVQHFLPNVKSARYRPPGFNRIVANSPKRALSAPGLQIPQPSHARRERRRNQNFQNANISSLSVDELSIPDAIGSPQIHGGSKSASPSPVVGSAKTRLRRGSSSVGSPDWSTTDEIERLVALDQQRQNNSSLGARSDSMASVYSGAGEGRSCTIPVRGEVEFGLQYNYKAGDLEIHVKQCRDLAAVDAKRNRSDPYVKVYLLPDKSKSGKRKTKVKKHTLNPIFDEVLKFHISLNDLETRTLWLTVWHSDMFGRNDFLGEVMMSLENKVFDNPAPQSYMLQERTEPFEDILSYKGEIIIGLKFVPPDATTLQKKGKRSKGTLNVKVKEAKNLTAVKSNGISDPFCKSYLLPDKGRNSKQKTPVQRRTCNPSWNHTFVYEDVSLQELSERCLELTVWDHDRLASNEFLGGLRFSLGSGKHYGKSVDWMDSTGKEISLWQSMLEKPNLWVEGCLPLRASLDPPNSIS
ncbi:UNVERIFIED_CONTAM: hypothetical protein PYX00_002154 [Menopon gallinae]